MKVFNKRYVRKIFERIDLLFCIYILWVIDLYVKINSLFILCFIIELFKFDKLI